MSEPKSTCDAIRSVWTGFDPFAMSPQEEAEHGLMLQGWAEMGRRARERRERLDATPHNPDPHAPPNRKERPWNPPRGRA